MAQFIALLRRNYDEFPEPQFTPALMEAEAEQARSLYTAGVFRQIWSRGDLPGAAVLLEATSADEALAALETLPLKKLNMLTLDTLVPANPYRGFTPRG
jgi:muconolactone delta-isomerase